MREVSVSETTLYGKHPSNTIDRLVPPKVNIHAVCEPLMGTSYVDSDGKTKAKYLPLNDCIAIYERALQLYVQKQERHLLLIIALYRRNVTPADNIMWCGDISADKTFLNLVKSLDPPFTKNEWQELRGKMPEGSWIYRQCQKKIQEYKY